MKKYEVAVDQLHWHCDPGQFPFDCTDEVEPLEDFIGQDRALRALEFGLAMERPGYNIYVAGLTGTGKTTIVKSYVQRSIKEKEEKGGAYRPEDWCYLHNFTDPDRPQTVNLPQGKGKVFRGQISDLLQKLRDDLSKAFSSEEYQSQRKKIIEETQSMQRRIFEELEGEARQRNFLLQPSPAGPVLIPLRNGEPISHEDYIALSQDEKKAIESVQNELLKRVEAGVDEVRNMEKKATESLHQSDQKVGEFIVNNLFQALLTEYKESASISQYLNDLRSHVLQNLDFFKQQESKPEGAQALALMGLPTPQAVWGRAPFLPFEVNVFVDNSETKGPPIVVESNPTFGNLFGKIERRFLLGGYLSDHTMLKAGALNLANGGFLILNTRDVLLKPGVWEGLKRAVKNREVRVEDPFEEYGFIAPQGLRPQPMPLQVKVLIIGDGLLYQLLSAYDEDFWELFRVKADFDYQIDRNKDNLHSYVCFISKCCQEEKLRPFDRTGICKMAEYGARAVADQEKLSSRFGQLKELVVESDYWAGKDGSARVRAEHVRKAMEEKIFRHNLIDEHIREMIERGTIMIDTDGRMVGQVNGLSVYILGDIAFGKPSRITAKTFMGRRGIINIERESQLSGRIHDKGVLILSGYLGWKYAQNRPLSLSASLCFEQSYEGVEGDSASSTELYAILSSLSNISIRQDIAVTGSVNQKGEVQPIGGVNQKIEGFFQICQAKGLTDEQGVLIPHKNLTNLMLKDEVVEAARQGKFHIYAVKTVDEGIEVLTGVEAGERGADGSYPEKTINYMVSQSLKEMAEGLKGYTPHPAE